MRLPDGTRTVGLRREETELGLGLRLGLGLGLGSEGEKGQEQQMDRTEGRDGGTGNKQRGER